MNLNWIMERWNWILKHREVLISTIPYFLIYLTIAIIIINGFIGR